MDGLCRTESVIYRLELTCFIFRILFNIFEHCKTNLYIISVLFVSCSTLIKYSAAKLKAVVSFIPHVSCSVYLSTSVFKLKLSHTKHIL